MITGAGDLDAESCDGEVAARASAVSLPAEFGREAACGDPLGRIERLGCIERAATAWLR